MAVVAGALAGLLLGIYLVGAPGTPGFGYRLDLDVYRLGAQAFAAGAPLYDHGFRTDFGEVLPFVYPPIAAIMFFPLAVLPMVVASILVLAASVWAAVWVLVRINRVLGSDLRGHSLLLALPVLLLLDPIRMTLFLGQINLLLLALVVTDVVVLSSNHKYRRWRGVLVGVAAAIKLTPFVFVLWFLIDGDRRAAARAVVAAAGVTLIGFLLAPAESLEYWTRQIFRLDPQLPTWASGNQNLRPIANWFGLDPRATMVLWLALALLALGLAVLAAVRCARRGEPLLGFIAISAGGLLASPISWSHHWVWLLPVLPVLAASGMRVLAGAGLTIFAVGPQIVLVGLLGDERGWTPWLHVVAAAPVLWTVVLLAVLARRPRHDRSAASRRPEFDAGLIRSRT